MSVELSSRDAQNARGSEFTVNTSAARKHLVASGRLVLAASVARNKTSIAKLLCKWRQTNRQTDRHSNRWTSSSHRAPPTMWGGA